MFASGQPFTMSTLRRESRLDGISCEIIAIRPYRNGYTVIDITVASAASLLAFHGISSDMDKFEISIEQIYRTFCFTKRLRLDRFP